MFVPLSTFVTLARPSPLPHWAHLGWVEHIAVRWRSGQLQPGFKAKRRVKFGEVKLGSVRVKTYRLIRDTARLQSPLGRLISLWWDLVRIRVAEVVQRHEGPSLKSLDSAENFKPKHTLFSRDIKICRGYALFVYLRSKKWFFLG